MPGNRPGNRPRMEETSPGSQTEMPEESFEMSEGFEMPESFEMSQGNGGVNLEMPEESVGADLETSKDYAKFPQNRDGENGWDDMISSQPWERMPKYPSMSKEQENPPYPQGPEDEAYLSGEPQRQENSFPSVGVRRKGEPSSATQNGAIEQARESTLDDAYESVQGKLQSDAYENMQGNMPEDAYENMQKNMRKNTPQRFMDGMEQDMPWFNTMNSERMVDEYLMGMPRMEKKK